MGFYDFINFVVYDNPVSKTVVSYVTRPNKLPPVPNVTVITEKVPLWKLAQECGPFVKIAAVMGASAVALGAYGAHRTYPKDREAELRLLFETANKYHFYNTFALLGLPLCRNPKIASIFLLSGAILFPGPLYYHAFTGDNRFGQLAPFGGVLLIVGWLSMVILCPCIDVSTIANAKIPCNCST